MPAFQEQKDQEAGEETNNMFRDRERIGNLNVQEVGFIKESWTPILNAVDFLSQRKEAFERSMEINIAKYYFEEID